MTDGGSADREGDAPGATEEPTPVATDQTPASGPTGEPTVRVRGIYTTALTQRLLQAGLTVVQATPPIQARFETAFPVRPASVSIESSRDRGGVCVSGDADHVSAVVSTLESIGIDTFWWNASVALGAVYDAEVLDGEGGRGVVVDLGDGERGYLGYDDVDGYVDAGNRYRVQVSEATPPWTDDHPRVVPTVEVGGGLCTLVRGRTGVSASVGGDRGDELVGMTELLAVEVPEGWGVRWHRPAVAADLDAMTTALEFAVERAATAEDRLEAAPTEPDEPGAVYSPETTAWVWFGRESRFALDDVRGAVVATMTGHHRIKAADSAASAAVDFVEAVCDEPGESSFPFEAVSVQFGPTSGDRLGLGHGKPEGQCLSLGEGEVTEVGPDGSLTLERHLQGGGTYDALDVPIEPGDVAITKLREGRWWYPTTYRRDDGSVVGTYVNVCTPVELFPTCARYVDLHVDVIRRADGTVERVDDDELDAAREAGHLTDALAKKARSVAGGVERALES